MGNFYFWLQSIRLFVNETNPLSFDDAEARPATQEFELEFDNLNKPLPLRFVKFQKVNNLTIFIKVRIYILLYPTI